MIKDDNEKELTVTLEDNYDDKDPEFDKWIEQQAQRTENIIKGTTQK